MCQNYWHWHFLPSRVCWWLKKGCSPVDVFSTGWRPTGRASGLKISEFHVMYFSSTPLPALLSFLFSENDKVGLCWRGCMERNRQGGNKRIQVYPNGMHFPSTPFPSPWDGATVIDMDSWGEPANSGSSGMMAVKLVCMCRIRVFVCNVLEICRVQFWSQFLW